MSAHIQPKTEQHRNESIYQATQKIMPNWPLDKSIAVNPWHSQIDIDFYKLTNKISTISKANLLFPLKLKDQHEINNPYNFQNLDNLSGFKIKKVKHIIDLAVRADKYSWDEIVVNNISNECGQYFSRLNKEEVDESLYTFWLRKTKFDYGIEFSTGARGLLKIFNELPENEFDSINYVLDILEISAAHEIEYLHMLLLDVIGWSSYASYLKWSFNLYQGKYVNAVESVLACRLAWEYVIFKFFKSENFKSELQSQLSDISSKMEYNEKAFQLSRVMQEKSEKIYQHTLFNKIVNQNLSSNSHNQVLAQAVFCIDVRSERMRRAIESLEPKIETKGFAGFFGLPISYQPKHSNRNFKLLPALLPANYLITDLGMNPRYQQSKVAIKNVMNEIYNNPLSMFSLVELTGATYAVQLYRELIQGKTTKISQYHQQTSTDLCFSPDKTTIKEKAAICQQILQGMSLVDGFAKYVFIIGHGAECNNNPHKASLHCGACGGQSGEVNALLLAELLNNIEIRDYLNDSGINIPKQTVFVAGIHNTTSDEIILNGIKDKSLFDDSSFKHVRDTFFQAQKIVQRERLSQFGTTVDNQNSIDAFYSNRCSSPSQIRPEWGLVNNSAFIIGSRKLTQGINLEGRAFLHDYDDALDKDGLILNSIMTAPMVVASWINIQYFASTVDNKHYGAGSKILHNVVGGNIGVIEGSSGDLRIGLPLQSVHDGQKYMHEALRLHVIVQAAQNKIDKVLRDNPQISSLFGNNWLLLFCFDTEKRKFFQYKDKSWQAMQL